MYLIDGRSSYILIDAGNGENIDIIFKRMEMWGLDPNKISTLFLTHAHWDHAGEPASSKIRGVKILSKQGDRRFRCFRRSSVCRLPIP